MKSTVNIVGILLVIAGIIIIGVRGFSYQSREKVAEIGNVQVTAQEEKIVYLPPIMGGIAIVAGIILVIIGSRRKS